MVKVSAGLMQGLTYARHLELLMAGNVESNVQNNETGNGR